MSSHNFPQIHSLATQVGSLLGTTDELFLTCDLNLIQFHAHLYDQKAYKKIIMSLFYTSYLFRSCTGIIFSCLIVSASLQQVSEFDLFTLDDIDSAFQNITRLTYSQNYYMSGKFLVVLFSVSYRSSDRLNFFPWFYLLHLFSPIWHLQFHCLF